jgi:hypothetical protein
VLLGCLGHSAAVTAEGRTGYDVSGIYMLLLYS